MYREKIDSYKLEAIPSIVKLSDSCCRFYLLALYFYMLNQILLKLLSSKLLFSSNGCDIRTVIDVPLARLVLPFEWFHRKRLILIVDNCVAKVVSSPCLLLVFLTFYVHFMFLDWDNYHPPVWNETPFAFPWCMQSFNFLCRWSRCWCRS